MGMQAIFGLGSSLVCAPWHAMVETESSWSSGVHAAYLHSRSRIVQMSMWFVVLLGGSCGSWCEGWYGGKLRGLYVAHVLLWCQVQ